VATVIGTENEYKPKREVPTRKTKIKTGRGYERHRWRCLVAKMSHMKPRKKYEIHFVTS
jgi:hypothetical protein